MPFAVGGNSRIRTNIPAENAYNALEVSNRNISLRQLRLSTGKRINNASDDVAGYITSRALAARNGSLKAAQRSVADAQNVTAIALDSYENIASLLTTMKDTTAQAASAAMGESEKVALAKAAYRMAEQIQTVVDSTVFAGQQLIKGNFKTSFAIATNATNQLIPMEINLTNAEANVKNNFNIALESGVTTADLNVDGNANFVGVKELNLKSFDLVKSTDLGIFHPDKIGKTLQSLANAIDNVNKIASFVGGVVNRLSSQEEVLKGQITNYNSAISRIEDADVALEQLELVKAQFLQSSSLTALAQANANPQQFLQLIKG